MQGGLVRERAREGRGAIALMREHEAFHPVRPPLIKMSLDADLVKLGTVGTSGRTVCGTLVLRSPSLAAAVAAGPEQIYGDTRVLPSAKGCNLGVYFEGVVGLRS